MTLEGQRANQCDEESQFTFRGDLMETTLPPEKKSRIYTIVGTLAWMLLSFVGGIYVGVHPEWVPNMPWAWHPNEDQPPEPTPHIPSSQPTQDTSTETPPTQTSPQGH